MSIRLSTVELQDFAAHIVEDQQDLEIIQSAIEDADIDADEFVSAEEAGHLPDFLQGVSSQARNNFIQQTNQWYQELTEDDPDAPLQVSQPLVATQEQNTEFKTPFYISYAQQAPETLKSWVRNNLPQLPDVDWNNKPKPYAGLEGENVLVIYNPGSQGGRLGRLKGAIESAFSKDSTKAANVEFMHTEPDLSLNHTAVTQKIQALQATHGKPVSVVVIGGDGAIGSVAGPVHDLNLAADQSQAARPVKAFITPREGTAADIANAIGAPTHWYSALPKGLLRWFFKGKDIPGSFDLVPEWSKGTIVADTRTLDLDVNLDQVDEGYVRANVPGHVVHSTTTGAVELFFKREEESRKARQAATGARLKSAESNWQTALDKAGLTDERTRQLIAEAKSDLWHGIKNGEIIEPLLAHIFRGLATAMELRKIPGVNELIAELDAARAADIAARNKSKMGFLRGVPEAIWQYLLTKQKAFDVKIEIQNEDGTLARTITTHAADVMTTDVALVGGVAAFPGVNPTAKGGAGIIVIPPEFVKTLLAFGEAAVRFRTGLTEGDALKLVPRENYILLRQGQTATITPLNTEQGMTVNGDPVHGVVKTLAVKANTPTVPTVMSPTSATASILDGIVNNPLTRWYTNRNAPRVLAHYGDQALRFVPEVDQPRFFPDGKINTESLTRYFDSAEGARTLAISPDLAAFVGEHAYFNAATAKSVAAHTVKSLGAGMAIGLAGNAILSQTDCKDSFLARSGVNIGSMILPDLAMNPTAFMQQAATPLKFAGNMAKSVAVASAVGRGTGEIAVALGAERGGFAEGAAHLTGALGTSYGMAYHGTRMAQLAGRAVAPGVAGTATIQAATRGAATVLRFGKAVPWILAAGLAIDGADLAADQFRTVEEKDLRAKAKTKYLDQNIDDAFGSHGDWTRHATGLAQFVGVNLLSEAFSSSLVSYAQDLNDEYSDNSTRDQIRKEKEDAAKLIAVKG